MIVIFGLKHWNRATEESLNFSTWPSLQTGTRQYLSYQVEWLARGSLAFNLHQQHMTQKVATDFSGQLHLQLTNTSSAGWQYRAVLVSQTTGENNQKAASLFEFMLHKNGIIDGINVMQGEQINAAMLLSRMQLVLPLSGENTWKTQEYDENGRYLATYSETVRTPSKINLSKSKNYYLALNEGVQARIVDSQSEFSVAAQQRWFSQLEAEENIKTVDQQGFTSNIELTLTMSEISSASNIEQWFESVNQPKKTVYDHYQLDQEYADTTANLALDDLIELQQSTDPFDGFTRQALMVTYLRQHPDAVFALVEQLTSGFHQWSPEHVLSMWRDIVAAGHPEAQQALINVFTDPQIELEHRFNALAHSHELERPTVTYGNALIAQFIAGGSSDENTEQEIGLMSIYVTGSLTSVNIDDNEVSKELAKKLIDMLDSSALSTEMNRQLLVAVTNSRNPRFADSVSNYIDNDDSNLRQGAMAAMSSFDDNQARQWFSQAYDSELNSNVKSYVLDTIVSSSSPHLVTWAQRQLFSEDELPKQGMLVHYLGENISQRRDSVTELRALAMNTDSIELKRLIYEYITPE